MWSVSGQDSGCKSAFLVTEGAAAACGCLPAAVLPFISLGYDVLTRQKPPLSLHLCPSAQAFRVFHFSSFLGVPWAQYVCVLCSYEYTQGRLGQSTGLLLENWFQVLALPQVSFIIFGFISEMVTWVSFTSEFHWKPVCTELIIKYILE